MAPHVDTFIVFLNTYEHMNTLCLSSIHHEGHISKQWTIYYFYFLFLLCLNKTVNFINVFDTTFFIHTITLKYNFFFFFLYYFMVFFTITKQCNILSTMRRTKWECNKQFFPLTISNLSHALVQFSDILWKELHCNGMLK